MLVQSHIMNAAGVNENSVSGNENSCSGNKSSKSRISSSISKNITKVDGADIIPTYDTDSLEQVDNDDYNVFAMEKEHHEQPESVNDTYMVEQGDTDTTLDLSDMSNNGREVVQDDDLEKERKLLASLIEQMKLEIDGSNKTNKSLESSNKALREANTFLNNELKRYKESDFVKNVELKCAKAYGLLEEQKVTSAKSFNAYTEKIIMLNQKISEMENELSALQRTISIISYQKEEHEKFFKTREDKEIKKVISLEKQELKPTGTHLTNDVVEFYQTLKEEMVADLKYFKSLENEVESLQSQLKLQQTQLSNEIDRLSREYYYADHMKAILGVMAVSWISVALCQNNN
ncbi:hypothetical protein Tco_0378073 [Tanacetum coccineum]